MGFEDVRAQVEWEARRIGAAFGMTPIQHIEKNGQLSFEGESGDVAIDGEVAISTKQCSVLLIHNMSEDGWGCLLRRHGEKWCWDTRLDNPDLEFIGRGLYCLGVEDENLPYDIPHLSALEKLELRPSMPREFWPEKWLDVEG